MEIRNLGRSGLRVSIVGLGCNNFGQWIDFDQTTVVVNKAIDVGITLFDTSDTYGNRGLSEEYLGKALGPRRKDIVLATKFGMPMDDVGVLKGGSRRYIMRAVDDSLRRLGTDWIDLYQLHQYDPLTPMEETLRALDDLVRQGKVRYIGCSNLPAWRVAEAHWIARELKSAAFVSCQDEYSMLVRRAERDVLPVVDEYRMGFLPYFPLASGLLTGKYRRGEALPAGGRLSTQERFANRYMTPANWSLVERLSAFAKRRDHTLLELAFSWLLSKPQVSSVIAGSTKPEQIEQNIKAAGWRFTPEEQAEIDAILAETEIQS